MWPEHGLELGNLQVEQTHQHGSQARIKGNMTDIALVV